MTLPPSRRLSTLSSHLLLSSVLALGLGASHLAHAQVAAPVPANVVNIAASGVLEVPQDWLSMSLNTTREGSDASTVQNQLKQALDAALTVARASAKPQQLEVRTGQFSLYPRYTSSGKINGWQGSTELVLVRNHELGIATTPDGAINAPHNYSTSRVNGIITAYYGSVPIRIGSNGAGGFTVQTNPAGPAPLPARHGRSHSRRCRNAGRDPPRCRSGRNARPRA